ncbi:hypothetical protein EAG18_02555 [Pseudoalteromonas sp. J010]|uniref:hypothetical protein n=1 Tax=Pseudoalteromonas sp. J010 TaxID=998465 RepID=UPI000F651E67|nr:hypothetical protein [Pseudoalteromonas sp. J010]RRS10114.1 hypothetical protein EAG18_02555 [Pseudoalteromonas sp. J010]
MTKVIEVFTYFLLHFLSLNINLDGCHLFLYFIKARFLNHTLLQKKLIIDGLKISESANYFGEEKYNEQKRMEDGAAAMRELLQGISAEKI